VLGLDGVYSTSADGRVVFTATRAPAQSELLDVTQRVHTRVHRWLKRHGAGDEQDKADDDEPSPAASCAQLSLRLGKLGYVDSDGVAHEPDPDHARFGMRKNTPWSAEHEGWSLHAGVTIAAGDDEGRERLCRYVVRHALSMERMSWTKDGRIDHAVKYARSPTRTHLLLEPMQFLARLAALVPAPRHPLVRYVGVLSSASKWRPHVAPHKNDERSRCQGKAGSATASSTPDKGRPARTVDASRTAMASPADKHDPPQPDGNLARGCVNAGSNHIDWHTLRARVYDIDSLKCPKCGGQLRLIAMLTEPERTKSSLLDAVRGGPRGRRPSEPEPIRAILESMGLPSTPPVPARARYPSRFDESKLEGCDVA